MAHRGFRGTLVSAAVGAAFGTIAGNAGAAGFALIEQNASGLGNAYSGQAAAAEDASTIWFNPAGMTRIGGRQAVGALNVIKPSTEFSDNGSTPPTLAPISAVPLGHTLGGTGGDAGDWAVVPNGYLSWEVMPNQLWLGIGLNAPFGLKTEWDSGWMGRFHAIESEVKTVNINPSVAWKINNMFSVGAGFNAMYLDSTLSNSVSYRAAGLTRPAALGGPVVLPLGSEGVATVEGDDWGYGWNLGAMINLSPDTRIGLTYRSKIDFTLTGDVRFSDRPAALNGLLPDGDIRSDIEFPDMFSVAVSHTMGRWQFLADYTWTGWDSIQDLSIYRSSGAGLTSTPLNFENSWRAGLGVNYQLNGQWKLRGGIAYDTTPVKDEFRTPRLPDEDRTWLAAGAQWQMSKQIAFDFGLAYLFVSDANSNLPNFDPAPPAGFTAAPKGNLRGTYEADVWILSGQVRFNF
jgi:long-chain fatty acid transport protein